VSHFCVTVCLPGEIDEDHLELSLHGLLDRFDENKEVPRYIEYTRDGLIAKGRKEIESYRDTVYAEYLADPAAYADRHPNIAHLKYLAGRTESVANLPAVVAQNLLALRDPDDGGFPARLEWTDEQVHAHQLQFYEPEDVRWDGAVWSTYNPDSKWDWFQIGGRWPGRWKLNAIVYPHPPDLTQLAWCVTEREPGGVDVARLRDIAPATLEPSFAIVDLESVWHEKGEMGWWAIVSNEKADDEWAQTYSRIIGELPEDTWLINVDCHI
jgi:hypothetical protein